MCDQEWPKQWQRIPKHRQAKPTEWQVSYTRKWSGDRYAPSQYNPELYGTDEAVRRLELDCVEHGIEIENTGKRKTFYRLMDHTVGACSGEFTRHVFAEWHISGAIHGRPISETRLKTKVAL